MLPKIEAKEEDVLRGIELLQNKGYILRSDIKNIDMRPYSRDLVRKLEEKLGYSVNGEHVAIDIDYYEVIYLWEFREEAIREAKKEMIIGREELLESMNRK